jgi:putative transposase
MKSNEKQNRNQVPRVAIANARDQIRDMLREQMRNSVLEMIQGFFSQEVEELCGKPFSRKLESKNHRGGWDKSSVILDGERVQVKKPRVRAGGDEVVLESHSALQEFDMLCERVTKHMLHGVSTRNYEPLLDEVAGSLGLKKSSVSKAFVKGSKQALEEINARDLKPYDFVAIMIDGIGFGERTVVAAIGFTRRGEKLVLGLREGDTENAEVCRDLLTALIDRGLSTKRPILFVTDGGKALKKAIRKVFGTYAPIQRCVRHKERNVIGYLPKANHMEFRRRWKKLHGNVSYNLAKKEHQELLDWLGEINDAAMTSLAEADQETLTVIKLNVPALLKKTLLSTNPIESAFSVVEYKTRRVKNWKSGTDQASRWAASALLEAEKRFRQVKGFKEIEVLVEALNKLNVVSQEIAS